MKKNYLCIFLFIIFICSSVFILTDDSGHDHLKREYSSLQEQVKALKKSYVEQFYEYYHTYELDWTFIQSLSIIAFSWVILIFVDQLRAARSQLLRERLFVGELENVNAQLAHKVGNVRDTLLPLAAEFKEASAKLSDALQGEVPSELKELAALLSSLNGPSQLPIDNPCNLEAFVNLASARERPDVMTEIAMVELGKLRSYLKSLVRLAEKMRLTMQTYAVMLPSLEPFHKLAKKVQAAAVAVDSYMIRQPYQRSASVSSYRFTSFLIFGGRIIAYLGIAWGGYEIVHKLWRWYREDQEIKPLEERLIFLEEYLHEIEENKRALDEQDSALTAVPYNGTRLSLELNNLSLTEKKLICVAVPKHQPHIAVMPFIQIQEEPFETLGFYAPLCKIFDQELMALPMSPSLNVFEVPELFMRLPGLLAFQNATLPVLSDAAGPSLRNLVTLLENLPPQTMMLLSTENEVQEENRPGMQSAAKTHRHKNFTDIMSEKLNQTIHPAHPREESATVTFEDPQSIGHINVASPVGNARFFGASFQQQNIPLEEAVPLTGGTRPSPSLPRAYRDISEPPPLSHMPALVPSQNYQPRDFEKVRKEEKLDQVPSPQGEKESRSKVSTQVNGTLQAHEGVEIVPMPVRDKRLKRNFRKQDTTRDLKLTPISLPSKLPQSTHRRAGFRRWGTLIMLSVYLALRKGGPRRSKSHQ